ncbi:MAG: hypothetical protein SFT92_02525 [Rickettsiales bacterium]|nr:hypothetical protein [Rickettsiales bacterium]
MKLSSSSSSSIPTSLLNPPLNITIDTIGGLGDGIASHQRKPVFVPKSAAGDELSVRVIKETGDAIRAEIVSIIKPGPDRVSAPCPYYEGCGGCSMMHINESAYQSFKRIQFINALHHAGFALADPSVEFIPFSSRRRVELKCVGGALGFYRQRSHDLIPIDHCIILRPALDQAIGTVKAVLPHLSMHDAIDAISLTETPSGLDMVISLRTIPANKQWFEPLTHLPVARLSIRDTNDTLRTVYQKQPLTIRLGNYDVFLPPDAFLQATLEGQELLTYYALQGTKGAKQVVDLFCGIGTYSFPLSERTNVHAVELDKQMVSTLIQSAKQHRLEQKITAETRDLFKKPLTASELNRFDAAVINPPRLGSKAQIQEIAKSTLPSIVMISCNPATWSRDAKILKEAGFTLDKAVGIDQFVYSPHLEIASIFTR